jgi:hypothetical protein
VQQQLVQAHRDSKLAQFFENFGKEYEVDVLEAKDYVVGSMAAAVLVVDRKDDIMSETMADAIVHKMIQEGSSQGVYVISKSLTYSKARSLSFKVMEKYFKQTDYEKNVKRRLVQPFVVSQNFEAEGIVAAQVKNGLVDIMLTSFALKGLKGDEIDAVTEIYFFGDKKIGTTRNVFSAPYYVYRFHAEEKDFVIFSAKPIEIGTICRVKGMLVDARDETKLGEKFAMPVGFKVVFVTELIPSIKSIDLLEFKERTWGWTHDTMTEKLLGLYRQPTWYEKALLAFVVSAEYEGYPLNHGVYGPTGSGKTKAILNPLRASLGEEMVYEGTYGTIRGLVPNFGKSVMDPGWFVRCKRVCTVDEFFQLFKSSSTDKDKAEADSGLLTSLLEHQGEHGGASGKTESFKVKARARMIACTNPRYKMGSLVEAAASLNNPMLSRFLWYNQLESHTDFNRARKQLLRNVPEEARLPKCDPQFIEVVDFLQSFTLEVPIAKVEEIYKEILELVPIELENIYKGRYDHHLICLIDGVSKLNAIFEQRPVFEVTDADLQEAKTIFATMVGSWTQASNWAKLPMTSRKEFLPLKVRKVFDAIEEKPGCSLYEAERLSKENAGYFLPRLEDAGLVFAQKKMEENGLEVWELFPWWWESSTGRETEASDEAIRHIQ